jgi:hypothetical protein
LEDPQEVIKAKKLKKKTPELQKKKEKKLVTSQTISTAEEPGTSKGIAFDEVLEFNEADKFDNSIQISKGEGIGLLNNTISIFKVFKKNNVKVMSNYSFNFPVKLVPNMIIGLKRMYDSV